jgi:flagellin-like hook-associated protein FlgL
LQQAQNVITSATSAAISANSGTTNPGADSALAAQVNAAINQLLGIANTQLSNGTYIFGGTASQSPPFVVSSANSSNQPNSVTYQGSQNDSQVIVGKSLSVNTLISGSSVFQPDLGGATVYSGSTGATAGAGVDTGTGQGTLQVQHTVTTYDGTSGVIPGDNSAAGDTALGPDAANSLVINDNSGTGASGTVSLNGGPAVAFNNTDTNLKVTGPSGEVVYLNTTSITPGFKGTVTFQSDGTLSTDGGATTTPINFSSTQAITNSNTGAVTNVNSSNIRQVGNEQLDYPGKADVFQTLIALRDTINNTQGLSAADRSAALTQQLGELQRINSAIATPLGNQSTQAQFLSNLQTRTTTIQTNLKEATSSIQSTDMVSAIVGLQHQQNLYQAGLQLAATVNQLSLANYFQP